MLDPLTHIQLIGGFVLLFVGGEALVRGAVSLAQRLHVSPLLIGATVVAFGTSMPELVVTLQAALRGSFGIAFGNVIGSNVANLMLILGLAVVIKPVLVSRRAVARDGGALIGATALLVVFTSLGTLVAWQGALMLVLLGLLTCASYWHERRLRRREGHPPSARGRGTPALAAIHLLRLARRAARARRRQHRRPPDGRCRDDHRARPRGSPKP